jgi:hypothetical protein
MFGRDEVKGRASRTGRPLACEGLEGRLVLSTAGVTPPMGLPMMGMFGPLDGGVMASGTARHDIQVARGGKGSGPVAFHFNPANLSPQAQADFQKLQADMKAIQAKSTVTPAEEQAVRQDFQQIAQYAPQGTRGHDKGQEVLLSGGANDPAHLGPVVIGKGPAPGNIGFAAGTTAGSGSAVLVSQDPSQMAADLTAQLQKENVPQSLITKTVADVQAVQAASNVTAQDTQTIAADRQAIATDLGHKM